MRLTIKPAKREENQVIQNPIGNPWEQVAMGLPVECGSGGLTSYNRAERGLVKQHWLDAACVGKSTPATLRTAGVVVYTIKACGHGRRQMAGLNRYGFPIRHRQRQKSYFGFRTGDMVKAVVTKGKKVGRYYGRVAVRASGNFDLATGQGPVTGISHRYCRPIQRADGYSYSLVAQAA